MSGIRGTYPTCRSDKGILVKSIALLDRGKNLLLALASTGLAVEEHIVLILFVASKWCLELLIRRGL